MSQIVGIVILYLMATGYVTSLVRAGKYDWEPWHISILKAHGIMAVIAVGLALFVFAFMLAFGAISF